MKKKKMYIEEKNKKYYIWGGGLNVPPSPSYYIYNIYSALRNKNRPRFALNWLKLLNSQTKLRYNKILILTKNKPNDAL